MKAAELIRHVERAGAQLRLIGDEIQIKKRTLLTPSEISALAHQRDAIRRYLRDRASDPWDGVDYRTFFEERAGISEYDGGLPREEAEWQAFEDSIQCWLHHNPPSPSGPERCVHCQRAIERIGEDGIPV